MTLINVYRYRITENWSKNKIKFISNIDEFLYTVQYENVLKLLLKLKSYNVNIKSY